ncbi:uncharacterized protein LOC110037899 isoform X2 [Phalaenopsis equestris]|nr:uncharacterized protein LOC110037899 isoform X2 [Phalaenopsis equestris]XP_020598295.1 uncharacterized protein LOC110037899 isoform X2 [Phalaenopsis equestris]
MPILQFISNTSIKQLKLGLFSVMNSSLGSATSCSHPKGHSRWSLQLRINKPSSKINYSPLMKDSSFQKLKKLNDSSEKSLEYISQIDDCSNSIRSKISVGVSDKERERRGKIGLANRGRTPWNKGRKHNEETRMIIKKRTIEALKDPKVRKKMADRPHSHSDQSKARISSSLKRFWYESLKHKRLQDKLYFSWARYIAEAAKQGSNDERELDWDSYQKIKADINFRYIQEREEKAKETQTAKLFAEKVSMYRAAKHAQKRRRKEELAKTQSSLRQNLLNKNKKKNDYARDLKLVERLTKIQYGKRILKISGSSQRESLFGAQPSVEKLDLKLIKEEKIQRSVSLADQLQTLKDKKVEFCARLL